MLGTQLNFSLPASQFGLPPEMSMFFLKKIDVKDLKKISCISQVFYLYVQELKQHPAITHSAFHVSLEYFDFFLDPNTANAQGKMRIFFKTTIPIQIECYTIEELEAYKVMSLEQKEIAEGKEKKTIKLRKINDVGAVFFRETNLGRSIDYKNKNIIHPMLAEIAKNEE